MSDVILTNALLAVEGGMRRGTVVLRGGVIHAVDDGGTALPAAIDCGGDIVMPGLVELHTDNLERHITPRHKVDWPHDAAILAHDAELAGCGITTVFDALRLGSVASPTGIRYKRYARPLASEIMALRDAGALRISHHLHLRAEICSHTLEEELEEFGPGDRVGLVSLMDHTPGQRQNVDESRFHAYVQARHGLSAAVADTYLAELKALHAAVGASHERAAVAAAARYGAALASHDDTEAAHVAQSAAYGVTVAEFPTTMVAARACRGLGIAVMMGAPNVIRGGSHSGNVAAADLAAAGLLDVLSSDYVPAALLTAAFRLGAASGDLAAALAMVTANPAAAVGLHDRGRLAPGLRADLVRVRRVGDLGQPRGVWVEGVRVA